MSEYICPVCNAKDTIEEMLYLDTENPETLDGILSQEFFTHTCKQCGTRKLLNLSALVYNKEKEYVITLKEQDDSLAPKLLLKRHLFLHNGQENRYLERIVKDPDLLTEKVLILEEQRDDRIIELAKLYTKAGLTRENPNLKIVNLFYTLTENGEEFAILTEEGFAGTCLLDIELCIQLEKELEKIPSNLKEETQIDEGWAMRALNSISSSK